MPAGTIVAECLTKVFRTAKKARVAQMPLT